MFVIPGAKLAHQIDLIPILQDNISAECGSTVAQSTQSASNVFHTLRKILSEPPDTERISQGISSYLVSLHYLLQVRPSLVTNCKQQVCWVDAFDSESVMKSSDLRLDRVSALFNLGVCAARIARTHFQKRRHDPNAFKAAANYFKLAAGYFRAASNQSLPDGIRTATHDLFPAALNALEYAMLGNAQQVFFMFAKNGASAPNVLARFAAGVRDYYATATEFSADNDIRSSAVNANIGLPCAALSAYFDIIVNETMAQADQNHSEHAYSLARLEYAEDAGKKAANLLQKWKTTSLVEINNLRTNFENELRKITQDVHEKKEDADKMNRTVFFLAKAENVPPVQPHQSLQSVDVGQGFGNEVIDDGLRIFADLPEAMPETNRKDELTTRYAEMSTLHVKDELASVSAGATMLRERIAQVETDIENARGIVESEARNSQPKPGSSLEEEQKAIDAILFVQREGGLSALRSKQETINGIAASAKSQIQSIELLLQQEETEDRELRSRIYVQRPVSATIAQDYHNRVAKIKGNLVKAANADMMLEREINSNAAIFRDLLEINLNGFLPPSARVSLSESDRLKAEYDGLLDKANPEVIRAKRQLEEVENLSRLFERKQAEEDPTTVTSSVKPGSTEVDELSDLLSRQYIDLDKRAASIRDEMNTISSCLIDSGKKLRQLRPSMGNTSNDQNIMNSIYKNQAAANKFREIMNHFVYGGEDFYMKEKVNIDNLRTDLDGFVAARRTEARDIENFSQQQSSYTNPGQGTYPPTHDNGSSNNYYSSGGNPYSTGNQHNPTGGNGYSRYY